MLATVVVFLDTVYALDGVTLPDEQQLLGHAYFSTAGEALVVL